jgi:hypothetical protein
MFIEGSMPQEAAGCQARSPLFEIALLLVRLNYLAGRVVNSNHGMVRSAEKLRVIYSVAGGVRPAIPKSPEWQHIGNEINAAFVSARAHFVSVDRRSHRRWTFNHFLIALWRTKPAQSGPRGHLRDRGNANKSYV